MSLVDQILSSGSDEQGKHENTDILVALLSQHMLYLANVIDLNIDRITFFDVRVSNSVFFIVL